MVHPCVLRWSSSLETWHKGFDYSYYTGSRSNTYICFLSFGGICHRPVTCLVIISVSIQHKMYCLTYLKSTWYGHPLRHIDIWITAFSVRLYICLSQNFLKTLQRCHPNFTGVINFKSICAYFHNFLAL